MPPERFVLGQNHSLTLGRASFCAGDGSGSWKCFSFWSLLEDNPCYVCVCLPSFFAFVPKQDQVQGYLLQGASVLMSPSEICSHFLQLVALRPHGA